MATNVLDFHRYAAPPGTAPLLARATIAEPADIAAAAAALAEAAQAMGLRIIAWHDLATLEKMRDAEGRELDCSAFGWDAAALAPWHCRETLLASALLRTCRLESDPFWIDRHGARTRWRNRVAEGIAGAQCAVPGQARSAIALPVRLAFGQLAAAILVPVDPLTEDLAALFGRCIETLCAPVERFLRGYVMVSRDARYLPEDCLLTPREIECLGWVAHGKTDYEISIILGCSHAGVRYHVTRACAKLGAVNRAQSVFRAAQLGYLGPAPPPPQERDAPAT